MLVLIPVDSKDFKAIDVNHGDNGASLSLLQMSFHILINLLHNIGKQPLIDGL